MLSLGKITRLVFGIADDAGRVDPAGQRPAGARRIGRAGRGSPGCVAFDFGTSTSPVMDGFTADHARRRSTARAAGYGLKDARIWHAFDALQPDPLYQDFLCIEDGGLAVNLPNGKYRVFVNIDSPSGFWGEYQTYRKRADPRRGPAGRQRDDGLRCLQGASISGSGTSRTGPTT